MDPDTGEFKPSNGSPSKRKRREFAPEQKAQLEIEFRTEKYPEKEMISEIAQKLQLEDERVKNWFSKRREKWNRELVSGKKVKNKKEGKKSKESGEGFNPKSIHHRLMARSLIPGNYSYIFTSF